MNFHQAGALVVTTCDDLAGWANALASPRFTNDVKARLPTRLGRALEECVGKTCLRASEVKRTQARVAPS
jgi:hypothetical protein